MAHKGYIHYDIKPANIILRADSDEPILVDFGTVKEARRVVQASYWAQLGMLCTGDDPGDNSYSFPKLACMPEPLQNASRAALKIELQDRPNQFCGDAM